MSFKSFIPMAAGRRGIGDGVSLTNFQINFGKNEPPYEYLVIEYDRDHNAIRFSEGTVNNGYKVKYNRGSYFINAISFLKKGLLPKGWYSPIAVLTFSKTGEPSDTKEEEGK